MKSVCFVLAGAALIAACDGPTAPRSVQSSGDDSRLPASVRATYDDDASCLAVRDVVAKGAPEVPIPPAAIQPYYDALVSVYNASALPWRDTVVDVYQIHTFCSPALHRVTLGLAASEAWAQRLARREIPTGDASVDTLIARYALSVGYVSTLSNGDVLVTLVSTEPLNTTALSQLFVAIAGVRFAEPGGTIGDGNNIAGSIEDARVLLDYSVGYGDCPAGCTARRFYHFAVHDDGTVEYLGASGSPPPQPRSP